MAVLVLGGSLNASEQLAFYDRVRIYLTMIEEHEIERLQGELSQVREILWDREAEIERLQAEIARLQAELATSKNNPRPRDEG